MACIIKTRFLLRKNTLYVFLSNHSVFLRLINQVPNAGNVMSIKKYWWSNDIWTNENEEAVLSEIDEDPFISVRTISCRLATSKTVQHILKEKITCLPLCKVYNLLSQDYVQKTNFYTWLLLRKKEQFEKFCTPYYSQMNFILLVMICFIYTRHIFGVMKIFWNIQSY